MCLVVDTNCMASVFRTQSQEHEEFKDVRRWIVDGKGKLIIGGTNYLKEINSYLGIIAELSRNNKIVRIDDSAVDKENEKLKSVFDHKDYDDPHVIALLSVSKCKIICSNDKRAHKYFKNRDLYLNKKVPAIYSSSRNKKLLCDQNICECCNPCNQSSKRKR